MEEEQTEGPRGHSQKDDQSCNHTPETGTRNWGDAEGAGCSPHGDRDKASSTISRPLSKVK
jgi:hypothetical protein